MKGCQLITSIFLFFFSTGGYCSAASPELSTELKPLAKFTGQWVYTTTDSKGNRETGTVTISVGANGRSITVKGDQDASQDGLWFYDPELRKIVAIGVSSDGTVTKRAFEKESLEKDEFSFVSTHVMPNGKTAFSVGTIKWTGNDAFLQWVRSSILDGKVADNPPTATYTRKK